MEKFLKKMQSMKEETQSLSLQIDIKDNQIKDVVSAKNELNMNCCALKRQIEVYENRREESLEKLKLAETNLIEALRVAEQSDRNRRKLAEVAQNNADRIDSLTDEVRAFQMAASSAQMHYEEEIKRLRLMEKSLNETEDKVDLAHRFLHKVSKELAEKTNSLKLFELNQHKLAIQEETIDQKVELMQKQIEEMNERTDTADKESERIERHIKIFKDEAHMWTNKYNQLAKEIDSAFEELFEDS